MLVHLKKNKYKNVKVFFLSFLFLLAFERPPFQRVYWNSFLKRPRDSYYASLSPFFLKIKPVPCYTSASTPSFHVRKNKSTQKNQPLFLFFLTKQQHFFFCSDPFLFFYQRVQTKAVKKLKKKKTCFFKTSLSFFPSRNWKQKKICSLQTNKPPSFSSFFIHPSRFKLLKGLQKKPHKNGTLFKHESTFILAKWSPFHYHFCWLTMLKQQY